MFENMTDKEFYIWLAGFFDGEGSVYIPRKSTLSVGISIGNTNSEVIFAIHKKINIGQVCIIKHENTKWSDTYIWRVRNYRDSGTILKEMLPYLTIKNKIAREALGIISRAKNERELLVSRNEMILSMLSSGLTGRDVAKRIGVSPSLVAGVHTGRIKISSAIHNRVTKDVPVWRERIAGKTNANSHQKTRTITL